MIEVNKDYLHYRGRRIGCQPGWGGSLELGISWRE